MHERLGSIGYHWPIHWRHHALNAHKAYEQLAGIHEQVAATPPGDHRTRIIGDEDLIMAAYDCGTNMVSNVARAVSHLAQHMSQQSKQPLTAHRTIERIREATRDIGIDCRTHHQGYDDLGEIIRVRDAIEHPEQATIYQNGSDWDRVPLAWLFSDLSLRAYRGWQDWMELIAADWEVWQETQPGPVTLTVKRGMRSRFPAKNAS